LEEGWGSLKVKADAARFDSRKSESLHDDYDTDQIVGGGEIKPSYLAAVTKRAKSCRENPQKKEERTSGEPCYSKGGVY